MSETELLRDCWYVAAHAGALARGAMLPVTLLDEQVLLGRDNHGSVFALRDFCPHRGIPLRYGRFDGNEIECCYHGWRFNSQGCCTTIPSLVAGDPTDVSKIKTPAYACVEQDGLIWVYMARDAKQPPASPPTHMLPSAGDRFRLVQSIEFPCAIDHAVIGLMDPAHGPFVHRSWWWRTAKSMHEKSKQFAPRGMGFSMLSHAPSSNSRAYRILGASGERRTEITFQLPGLRTELITMGEKRVQLLTALTPISAERTMLHQFLHTNIGLVNRLLPLAMPFAKAFIHQDMVVVKQQQEGLSQPHAPLMLLGDADAQALWYYRLKKEYLAAQSESRPFENPLKERTLKWRS